MVMAKIVYKFSKVSNIENEHFLTVVTHCH